MAANVKGRRRGRGLRRSGGARSGVLWSTVRRSCRQSPIFINFAPSSQRREGRVPADDARICGAVAITILQVFIGYAGCEVAD